MAEVFNNHHNEDNVDQVTPQNSSINCQENFPDLKKGIKLPESPSQWAIANEFFKITFSNHPISPQDLDNSINTMATVMYNYFSENFGFIESNISNVQFQSKYKIFSTKDLKKTLKKLKLENGNIAEIKVVAKKLRNILNNTDEHNNNNHTAEVDHDCPINKNFWGYVKKFSKRITVYFLHLTWHNVRLILLRHFLQSTRTKHLAFPVGFQNLLLLKCRLILTLRPIMRLQTSFVK